jgi:hypothetical protein
MLQKCFGCDSFMASQGFPSLHAKSILPHSKRGRMPYVVMLTLERSSILFFAIPNRMLLHLSSQLLYISTSSGSSYLCSVHCTPKHPEDLISSSKDYPHPSLIGTFPPFCLAMASSISVSCQQTRFDISDTTAFSGVCIHPSYCSIAYQRLFVSFQFPYRPRLLCWHGMLISCVSLF